MEALLDECWETDSEVDTASLSSRLHGLSLQKVAAGISTVRSHARKRLGARVIDGVRLFSTLDYFRTKGLLVDVVHIYVDEQVRLSRFKSRSILLGQPATEDLATPLAQKDYWARDLPQFEQVSRWTFDNSGPVEELLGFAAAVAADVRSD